MPLEIPMDAGVSSPQLGGFTAPHFLPVGLSVARGVCQSVMWETLEVTAVVPPLPWCSVLPRALTSLWTADFSPLGHVILPLAMPSLFTPFDHPTNVPVPALRTEPTLPFTSAHAPFASRSSRPSLPGDSPLHLSRWPRQPLSTPLTHAGFVIFPWTFCYLH